MFSLVEEEEKRKSGPANRQTVKRNGHGRGRAAVSRDAFVSFCTPGYLQCLHSAPPNKVAACAVWGINPAVCLVHHPPSDTNCRRFPTENLHCAAPTVLGVVIQKSCGTQSTPRLLALSFRPLDYAHRSLAHLRLRPSPDAAIILSSNLNPLAVASIPPFSRRRATCETEQNPLNPLRTIVLSYSCSVRLRRQPASTRRIATTPRTRRLFLAAAQYRARLVVENHRRCCKTVPAYDHLSCAPSSKGIFFYPSLSPNSAATLSSV